MVKTLSITQKDRNVLASIPQDAFAEGIDDVDYSKVLIEKPWGYEYSIYKNCDVDVWLLFLKGGHKTSMHCHPHKKSTLTVVSGEAKVSTLEQTYHVKAGDAFVIEKGVFHSTEAISPDGIYLLESETPINKKDLVRFDDPYGRRGKRYESGKFAQARDGEIMPSFYGCTHGACYQLGQSQILLTKIERESGHDILQDGAVAVILTGSISTTEGLFGCGDVVNVKLIKQSLSVPLLESLEILLIKRI